VGRNAGLFLGSLIEFVHEDGGDIKESLLSPEPYSKNSPVVEKGESHECPVWEVEGVGNPN
jgi:hypothetical protein